MSLLRSLAIQRRVIAALLIRELQARYGRDNLGFLWLMGEPLLFATGVLVLWRLAKGPYDRQLPVIAITLTGYLPLLLYRHGVSRALYCVRQSVGLLYHRQITLLDLFWARMVIEIAGNLLAFAFAFAVLYLFDLVHWPAEPPRLFLGYFYMTWFTVGTGLVVGPLSERSEIVEKIWIPFSYLMVPLSGAYFLALWLPENYRQFYLMIPTVSAYEMIRSGYFGDSLRSFWDQPYIALWSASLTFYGLYLFRQARYHLKHE
jgi:capsular polysaccharide transport system permease protein